MRAQTRTMAILRASAFAGAVRRGGMAGAVAVAGLTGVAAAQEPPTFPASLERAALLAWLELETDIAADRVVAVTPQALTAIVSSFPAGGGEGPRVVIRAEAMSPETHARTGALSWHVSLNTDCEGRRVWLGETTGYPERNLLGERRQLRSADADWRTPEPGTALDAAWRAVCDPHYRGPLQITASRTEGPPRTAAPPAHTPAAPTPKPPAQPSAARRSSNLVAQVGAAASDAEARTLLAGLGPKAAGRRGWVEKADVGGRVWYRAVVGGFADSAEAARFCDQLKAAGRACFVRAGRAG